MLNLIAEIGPEQITRVSFARVALDPPASSHHSGAARTAESQSATSSSVSCGRRTAVGTEQKPAAFGWTGPPPDPRRRRQRKVRAELSSP
jgi:hypothetical protein